MSEPVSTEMTERHTALLTGLAQMAYEQAQALHLQVMAAQTGEEAQRFASAFHKAGRAVRMCIALEARAAREQRAEERAAACEAEQAAKAAAEKAVADAPRKRIEVPRIMHLGFDPEHPQILYSYSHDREMERERDLPPIPNLLIRVAQDPEAEIELNKPAIHKLLTNIVTQWADDEKRKLWRQANGMAALSDTS